VDCSICDPEIFLKTNVLGTQCLPDARRRSGRGAGTKRDIRYTARALNMRQHVALARTSVLSDAERLFER